MAAPPVYRPGSIPVQARMAAPPLYRPGCTVETSLGQRPSVGQASIQAMLKPAYVPIALQEPKKQKGNFLAASGKQEANVVKITKAKADRKKVKDDAHKKWLGV